ncbi:hypothetical protein BP5796_08091 [Coleophoma crateriformis]|uniref:NAD-dependent epimerase/dehydratase domain-containing protein n=1 Tax=Coleophoma crateriformis TaxID=565419 RepID=A0A3D8RDC9_9HELO|nr:hypothetical protein BP5796_08091 [Coleophoma crateriformis]
MRVFVTGATGFVGAAVTQELLKAEHTVLGLVRSEASAEKLKAAGGEPLRGSIEDLDVLKRAASSCDGTIHLAFNHDFTQFEKNCADDLKATEAIGEVLEGTGKPFITTSGTLGLKSRPLATEDEMRDPGSSPRTPAEIKTLELASKGIRSAVVRLAPSTYGDGDRGFVYMLITKAKEKGASWYVGDGTQRWSSVHRLDAARLYVLVLEKGIAGHSYHAIADQGIPTKEIAEVIGRHLNVPTESKSAAEASSHLGFIAWALSIDSPTSSEKTQKEVGWTPTHVNLLDDLNHGTYFET